jgi:hypothetical protein
MTIAGRARRASGIIARSHLPLRRKSTTGARAMRLAFHTSGLARREQEAPPAMEWNAMTALVEGHPNLDVIVFYALASVILAATLYYFHHRQIE